MDQDPTPREKLHNILATLGAAEVSYQADANISLSYPAILYSVDNSFVVHADNALYLHKKRYQVTVIDRDPDSVIPDKVERLPLCKFDRRFRKDNLNHSVFTLYF